MKLRELFCKKKAATPEQEAARTLRPGIAPNDIFAEVLKLYYPIKE